MNMATATNTWTKLRNGDWGVKGHYLNKDDEVTVTNRSGKTSTVVITAVLWASDEDGTAICACRPAASHARRPAARTTGSHKCMECGRSGAHQAFDMSGIMGWACDRCDDGSLSFF